MSEDHYTSADDSRDSLFSLMLELQRYVDEKGSSSNEVSAFLREHEQNQPLQQYAQRVLMHKRLKCNISPALNKIPRRALAVGTALLFLLLIGAAWLAYAQWRASAESKRASAEAKAKYQSLKDVVYRLAEMAKEIEDNEIDPEKFQGQDLPGQVIIVIAEQDKKTVFSKTIETLKSFEADFLELLRKNDPEAKETATYALSKIDLDEKYVAEAVPLLAQTLGHQNLEIRRNASRALGKIGEAAIPAVEIVLKNKVLAGEALATLGRIGAEMGDQNKMLPPRLINQIATYLETHGESNERQRAAFALSMVTVTEGEEAPPETVDKLIRVLNDPNEDPKVLDYCIIALGNMGLGSPRAVDSLVRLLDHPDMWVWRSAATNIGKLKLRAIDPLTKQLVNCHPPPKIHDQKRSEHCNRVLLALGNVGAALQEPDAPALTPDQQKQLRTPISLLKQIINSDSKNSLLAGNAVLALGKLSRNSGDEMRKEVSSFLIKDILGTRDETLLRANAARALGEMKAGGSIGELTKLLTHDSDNQVRANAAYSLGSIGLPKAARALPALTQALHDDSWMVQRNAALVLKKMSESEDYAKPIKVKEPDKLTKSNKMYRNGYYYQAVSFPVKQGKTYRIDLESKQFDTFLYLKQDAGGKTPVKDQSGREVKDDDGGDHLNSRLYFTAAKNGNYYLWVTSYSPGETGLYHLSICEFPTKQ